MKRALLLTGLVALSVWAGTRAKDTDGSLPSTATDGVSLKEVQSCRASVRSVDGGTVNGGTVVSFYYDSVLGWVRSPASLDCVLEANKLLDGGAPSVQICPDTEVLASYGRVSFVPFGVVNASGAAVPGMQVRTECFGRDLP